MGTEFIFISFLLKDLLSTNKNSPAIIKTKNNNNSKNSFSNETEAPKKAKGIDPIRYGNNNFKLILIFFVLKKFNELPETTIILQINAIIGKI